METGQRFSPIADSFASRLKWIGGRAPREPVTLGILVFGVVAFGISPWFAWFTIASALLLLTWNTRMQGAWRGLLYFFALLPVLHWFNSMHEFLFHEDAVTGLLFRRDKASPLEIGSGLILAVAAGIGLVAVIRHRPLAGGVPIMTAKSGARQPEPVQWSNVPVHTFADVGGMDAEKRRIAAVVNNRLHPERFQRHGVTQNGILLYGPRGTGKTFLAEATAGEFRINYYHVQPTALVGGRSAPAKRTSGRHFSRHISFGLSCSSSMSWIPTGPSASNWAGTTTPGAAPGPITPSSRN